MNKKPEASVFLGTYLSTHYDEFLPDMEMTLKSHYQHMKNVHEHESPKSWCKFEDYEIITRLGDNSDPWNPLFPKSTVGIKWKAVGRAFYIKRSFRHPPIIKKLHKHKKNVPKKKRGKPILSLYRNLKDV